MPTHSNSIAISICILCLAACESAAREPAAKAGAPASKPAEKNADAKAPAKTDAKAAAPTPAVADAKPEPAVAEPEPAAEATLGTAKVASAFLRRDSATDDADGRPLPPWTSAHIENVFVPHGPKVGEKATVVFPRGLGRLDLAITEVTPAGPNVALTLEPITDRAKIDVPHDADKNPEYAYNVAVVYPVTSKAVLLDPKTAKGLPVKAKEVAIAVDIDGDGSPDFVETEPERDTPAPKGDQHGIDPGCFSIHRVDGAGGWSVQKICGD